MWSVTMVIARVLAEQGSSLPVLYEDAILMIKRQDAVIGDGCGPGDAGVPSDAATDAGNDAGVDAGVADAGVDAGPDSCTPGDAVTLVVRPRFSVDTGGARFAVLLVTPSRPLIESIDDPFDQLAAVTGARTEIREIEVQDSSLGKRCTGGCGGYAAQEPGPHWEPPPPTDGKLGDGAVVVETVGPYEVVRVQPASTAELATWLANLGYVYQQPDLDALGPYIDRGYTVVAVRVAVDRTMDGALTPISLTWAGSEVRLPVALGTGAASQPLAVYIAAEGRYELPGALVTFAMRTSDGHTGFLTRNEVVLDADSPDDDPVATHRVGDLEFQEVIVEERVVRVPVADCDLEIGCCGDCSAQAVRGDTGVLGLAVLLLLLRKRRGLA